jgi:hypothetical protein
MDVLFIEYLEFTLQVGDWNKCSIALSREESLREALEGIGIELIDYGSFTVQPMSYTETGSLKCVVRAYSKAFRERVERDAMAGR